MSKRKITQIADKENEELSISKAKRKSSLLTEESDPEKPEHTFPSSSPAAISGNNPEKIEEMVTANRATSSAAAASETTVLGHTKVFLPPFEHVLDSSKAQCMAENVPCDPESAVPNSSPPTKSLESIDVCVPKGAGAGAGDHVIRHCEERLDVRTQDQDRRASTSNADLGTASHLQADVCTKDVLEKQISFFLSTSNGKDADRLERRKDSIASFEFPLIKETSCNILAEHVINDSVKSNQNEEDIKSLDIGVDIIKSVKQPNITSNENGRGSGLFEHTVISPQKESSITQPLLVPDSLIPPHGKLSNGLRTCGTPREESGNVKGACQDLQYQRGASEEPHAISESCMAQGSFRINTKATDQYSLCTSGEPVEHRDMTKNAEQSSLCRKEGGGVTEQNGDKGELISEKSVPSGTPCVCTDVEKEVDVPESKREQLPGFSPLFCPQPDGDTHSESRKPKLKAGFCSRENGSDKEGNRIGMRPAKSTTVSPHQDVPNVLSQQEWKENSYEKLWYLIKKSDYHTCDLRYTEMSEIFSNTGIVQQNWSKIFMAETNSETTKHSPSFIDILKNGKENTVIHGENKSEPSHMQSCLSSVEIVPQLEREVTVVVGDPSREMNSDLDTQGPALDSDMGHCISAPSGHTCSLPLDLEFLPGGNGLEFLLRQQHVHSESKGDRNAAESVFSRPKTLAPVVNKVHPNGNRDEMKRISDPTELEDSTVVVCGLIKELSHLNRLVMNIHRDLDTFKRLKDRRNRQPGKLLPNGTTDMKCNAKKRGWRGSRNTVHIWGPPVSNA